MCNKQTMRALWLLPAKSHLSLRLKRNNLKRDIRMNRQRKNKELFLDFVISQEEGKKSGNAYSICFVNDKILIKANGNTLDKLWSFLFHSIFSPFKENLVNVCSIFTRLKADFSKDCLKTAFIVPMLSPFTFFILWLWLYYSHLHSPCETTVLEVGLKTEL